VRPINFAGEFHLPFGGENQQISTGDEARFENVVCVASIAASSNQLVACV